MSLYPYLNIILFFTIYYSAHYRKLVKTIKYDLSIITTRRTTRAFARLVLKIQKLAMLLQNLFFIIHHHIHYRKLYLTVG